MIWIGTSGWQYDSWRGSFYPADLPKAEWLRHFSARFPTVEVNNSFYRLPSEEAFARWRRETPPGFVVGVKASRFITHIKRLKEPQPSIDLFWSRARALGPKLGPVLFQLPPRFGVDLARLEGLLEALPRQITAALEFRDASWDTPDVLSLLDRHGAAWVIPDRPGWRVPLHVTGGWAYIRFHEGSRLGPFYPRSKLRRWADKIVSLPARDVFIYFNNDPLGAAIRDAVTLADLLRERGAPVVVPPGAPWFSEPRAARG